VHIERQSGSARASYAMRHRAAEELEALAAGFRRRHVVHVRGLVRGRLLRELIGDVAAARFDTNDVPGIQRERRLDASSDVLARLIFLANDPQLLQFVRDVTGYTDVGFFAGRVSRLAADSDHFAAWHDDALDERRVALSLNLSEGPLEGGELLIRRKGEPEPPPTPYGPPGDALLFRISEHLEHRVGPLHSPTPRTAFVGWYFAGPAFADLFERPGRDRTARRDAVT
jgi:hypothetical protein